MLKGVKPNLALILSEAGDALLRDLKYQKCHPLYFIPIISKIFFSQKCNVNYGEEYRPSAMDYRLLQKLTILERVHILVGNM